MISLIYSFTLFSFFFPFYYNKVFTTFCLNRYLSYVMDVATPTADCLNLVCNLLAPVIMKGNGKTSLSHQEVSLTFNYYSCHITSTSHFNVLDVINIPELIFLLAFVYYQIHYFLCCLTWCDFCSSPEPNTRRDQGSNWTYTNSCFWKLQITGWIFFLGHHRGFQTSNWPCSACIGTCC